MRNNQFVINQFSEDIDTACSIVENHIIAPKPNEVLISNKFIGINAINDRELYRGKVNYMNPIFPFVFGVEAVGVIEKLGTEVDRQLLGKAVTTAKVGTAYQEFQLMDSRELDFCPSATPDYLTLNPSGVSAWLVLEKLGNLIPGQTVAISAAAGGLGHILVQLCKMKNCEVVAICGSQQKVELLESLQCCDRIINHQTENVAEVLNQEYKNKIHTAIDTVGRGMYDALLENLAPTGQLIVVGMAAEYASETSELISQPRVNPAMYWKGNSIRCFMNHLYKQDHPVAREALFELYRTGKLKVAVDSTKFSGIEDISKASKYLLEGKSCGKVVVDLNR